MNRPILAAVAAVTLLMVTTACSSPGEPGAVISQTPTESAGSQPSPGAYQPTPYPMATSSYEVAARVGACMNALGWDVEVSGDGFTYEIPREQTDAFRRDSDQCQIDTNSVIPEFDRTPELATIEYEAMERYHTCLADHGVDVPPLPAYGVFEDRLLTEESVYDLSGLIGMAHEDPLRIQCNDPIPTFGTKG